MGSVEPLLFSLQNFIMIRKASVKDINKILEILKQVNYVHHVLRPDLFNLGTKYSNKELEEIINNENTPIFVYEENEVMGYIFCIIEKTNSAMLTNIKTLYIDDLCVDEKYRGKGIGKELYLYAKEFAKKNGIYNITLNVWEGNDKAKGFYESLGLKPQKTYLEEII